MHSVPESKKNNLWRKTVWHTNPDEHPLMIAANFVEVYCCEETNGYSIWYIRRLAKDDERGLKGVENADYLLGFYPKVKRDDAIERAVLIAHSDASVEKVIATLDGLAVAGQRV